VRVDVDEHGPVPLHDVLLLYGVQFTRFFPEWQRNAAFFARLLKKNLIYDKSALFLCH